MKPLFTHDCSACKFLGVINGMDAYVHERTSTPNDYILRHSSDGPDYQSRSDEKAQVDAFRKWPKSVDFAHRTALVNMLDYVVADSMDAA